MDSNPMLIVLLFLSLIASMACAPSSPLTGPIIGCEPEGSARPICGFQNPEDLVALPGGEAILVSEFGAMDGNTPGRLVLFTLDSEERRVLFRGGDADGIDAIWGDPACPGPPPPAFSPHGIHLSERPDGAVQLLAVQHGGRESIEFFEVEGEGTEFSVSWRGCVVAPDRTWLNSVAAIPSGGFVTTNMMERSSNEEDLAAAFSSGVATGYVVTWSPEDGFGRLPGSESAMPNGIEVSAEQCTLGVRWPPGRRVGARRRQRGLRDLYRARGRGLSDRVPDRCDRPDYDGDRSALPKRGSADGRGDSRPRDR